MRLPPFTGVPRARGHRHLGGLLGPGASPFERHTGAEIAVVALAATATALTAYGVYQQGQAQAAAMRYNARLAEQQALASRQAAAFEAERARERSRRLLARARAIYGTTGVEVNEGSPLLVLADSARQAELEAQTIQYGGELRARQAQGQANLESFQARLASRAGTIGAGATLLSGAARIAGPQLYSGTSPGAIRVPAADMERWGYL
ncbi:MAG TPA: hypothetical protein VNK50_13120 [Calidithermus sp.]|nr:hypothetical protein [Calidithermus sp.]